MKLHFFQIYLGSHFQKCAQKQPPISPPPTTWNRHCTISFPDLISAFTLYSGLHCHSEWEIGLISSALRCSDLPVALIPLRDPLPEGLRKEAFLPKDFFPSTIRYRASRLLHCSFTSPLLIAQDWIALLHHQPSRPPTLSISLHRPHPRLRRRPPCALHRRSPRRPACTRHRRRPSCTRRRRRPLRARCGTVTAGGEGAAGGGGAVDREGTASPAGRDGAADGN